MATQSRKQFGKSALPLWLLHYPVAGEEALLWLAGTSVGRGGGGGRYHDEHKADGDVYDARIKVLGSAVVAGRGIGLVLTQDDRFRGDDRQEHRVSDLRCGTRNLHQRQATLSVRHADRRQSIRSQQHAQSTAWENNRSAVSSMLSQLHAQTLERLWTRSATWQTGRTERNSSKATKPTVRRFAGLAGLRMLVCTISRIHLSVI